MTHDYIIRELWGPEAKTGGKILRTYITNIRRKIEPTPGYPRYILTVQGVGYRMPEAY